MEGLFRGGRSGDSTEPDRPPFAAAWFGLWGLFLVVLLVAAGLHGAGWAALSVVMIGAATTAAVWWWTGMSVTGEPDHLVVRNFSGTDRIPRTAARATEPTVRIELTTYRLRGGGFVFGRVVVEIRSPLQRSRQFGRC